METERGKCYAISEVVGYLASASGAQVPDVPRRTDCEFVVESASEASDEDGMYIHQVTTVRGKGIPNLPKDLEFFYFRPLPIADTIRITLE